MLFRSRKDRVAERIRYADSLTSVGVHPLDFTVNYKTWAGPDDCDFNMHLSNSSYAKSLDAVRFKVSATCWPTHFSAGGFIALGASHYKFIKEIPMMSSYEMRSSLVAWDQKWIYLLTRFVTLPKKGKKGVSPAVPVVTASFSSSNAVEQLASAHILRQESDGAVVNGVAISELCFKFGRITVPPALVIALDGFTAPPTDSSPPFSLDNPPPHWMSVTSLRDADMEEGSLKTLAAFLKGGWRNVPEERRWWERALGGTVEERRKRNLELIEGVKKGMDNAMSVY